MSQNIAADITIATLTSGMTVVRWVCGLRRRTSEQDYTLASCIIYAWALLEYVIIIMWLRSVIKMLRSVKFAEDKVLNLLILRENAKIVQL